jgi:hypothetical protein
MEVEQVIENQFGELLATGIVWGLGISGAVTLFGLGVASAIDLFKLFGGVR